MIIPASQKVSVSQSFSFVVYILHSNSILSRLELTFGQESCEEEEEKRRIKVERGVCRSSPVSERANVRGIVTRLENVCSLLSRLHAVRFISDSLDNLGGLISNHNNNASRLLGPHLVMWMWKVMSLVRGKQGWTRTRDAMQIQCMCM